MKTFEQLIADNYLTKKPSLEALRAALGRMIDSLGPDALFSLRNEVEICASFFAGSAPKKKHLNSADYVSQFITSDKTRPSLAYVYVKGGRVMATDGCSMAFANSCNSEGVYLPDSTPAAYDGMRPKIAEYIEYMNTNPRPHSRPVNFEDFEILPRLDKKRQDCRIEGIKFNLSYIKKVFAGAEAVTLHYQDEKNPIQFDVTLKTGDTATVYLMPLRCK